MKKMKLNNQAEIPILGFGTWQLVGDTCQKAAEKALEIGYRHIDTADGYGNHKQIAQAVKNSALKREDLFITSKVPAANLKPEAVLDCAQRYLEELQTDYLDLLLIHWPNPAIPIGQTLEAFAKLKEQGIIRAIGVSNFTIQRLKEALATGVKISNNQVEFHPTLNQTELKAFCDQETIVLTAYSPIGRGKDLTLPEIVALAKKYKRSPSQIILNWIMSQNIIAIPKAADPKHIEDNFKSLDFQLSPEDLEIISQIRRNNRLVNPYFPDFNSY